MQFKYVKKLKYFLNISWNITSKTCFYITSRR